MKKLFALMVTLAMLLCSAAACADALPAEAAPEDAPVTALTINSETDIDRDVLALGLATMGFDEKTLLKWDTIAAVLTEASERLTVADNGFQLGLILSGKDIFTVAGEMTDAGYTLGSNLLPNHVFSVSNDELAGLSDALASKYEKQTRSLERIDMNALGRAIAPHVENYISTALAAFKTGEVKQGDYALGGVHYNNLTPIDVDVAAIYNSLLKLKKDLLADPTVAVTIAQFDSSGKATRAVEKAIDPAKAPALHLDVYANVDGQGNQSGPVDTLFTVTNPGQKDPAATGDVLVNGEDVTVTVQSKTAGNDLVMSSRKIETGHTYKADLHVKGLYFGCTVETGEEEDRFTVDADIFFLDPENRLLGQRATLALDGRRTFDLSEGTPVALSDLRSDGNLLKKAKNRVLKAGLAADAMIGMANISAAAIEALPDEVNALLALFPKGLTSLGSLFPKG